MAFVLYHEYSDHSGWADIIYVGDDKAAAFDAWLAWNKESPAGDSQIKFKQQPKAERGERE